MSRLQSTLCRSGPWRFVSGAIVLRWSLDGFAPAGRVLEIGAGSGAMAAEVLARYPAITHLTATDVDPTMVDAAATRLATYGDRVATRPADATALPFDDASFDVVLSWIMLHHTVRWEQAVAEATRVLQPGGRLVGYDLLATRPLRALHRNDGDDIRLLRLDELRAHVDRAEPTLAGQVVRFTTTRR
jgi:ubiquinone/menaquinone biosynthesis C-methylase UbiE